MRIIETTVYKFEELSEPAKEKAREWYRYATNCDFVDFHAASAIEDFCEIASKIGFSIDSDDVHWSGFWSQGDGASFTGYFVLAECSKEFFKDLQQWGSGETVEACLKDARRFRADALRFYREVRACLPVSHWKTWREFFTSTASRVAPKIHIGRMSSRYSHECTMQVSDCEEWRDIIAEFMGDVEYDESGVDSALETLTECAQEFARSMAQNLYRAIELEYEYQNSDEVVDENITANEYEFTEDGKKV